MTKSERVKYGLYGAALGGSIAASIAFFYLETASLVLVAVGAALVCGLLASCFGEVVSERVIDWLKELWWWS